MDVIVNDTPIANSPFASCYVTNGSGAIGSLGVGFEGKLCVGLSQYSLSGTLTSGVPPANVCQAAPLTALAGELTVFGSVSTSGPNPPPGFNPIPLNHGAGGAIINIIGSVGQIPNPCPSP
jgi:hypothetical protein